MPHLEVFDVVVVGGGPAGATAAAELAGKEHSVLLLDRAGRIKPCGGAIPPRLIKDFDIPAELIVAKAKSARIVSPTAREVDMPIDDDGYVGMVDRDVFDEWLRTRAARAGAERRTGTFLRIERTPDGLARVVYLAPDKREVTVTAKAIVGADGANSAVARAGLPGSPDVPYVFAYHEIIRSPGADNSTFDGRRCDVFYDGRVSPDFYGWVFPHGDTTSVGVGSAEKGFRLRSAVARLRGTTGLSECETIRREGAPIPLRPRRVWDNGRDIVLAGDAAGVVAPASGEGIYYAMYSGRLAADAVDMFLFSGDARALTAARKRFMKAHGRVFKVLGIMQWFWYRNDARRERFVSMCRDRDVQKLTWTAYMNKELVRAKPVAHVRIFFKDLAHLLGLVAPSR